VQERFEADFWLPDAGYYAIALDGQDRPCRVISSNPGHCLWTGIVSPARAEAVTRRLMADDMTTGWGLRTLSSKERLYNPMSYHNGSVWPHDTAIAALGMLRYGFTESFLALTTGLFQAVQHFDRTRMPELFCGFPAHGQSGSDPVSGRVLATGVVGGCRVPAGHRHAATHPRCERESRDARSDRACRPGSDGSSCAAYAWRSRASICV
jgi:glycogen debranching enzyme